MRVQIREDMNKETIHWLDLAHRHAHDYSGCWKVTVGSVIVSKEGEVISFGTNRSIPNCKVYGCRRIQLYGNDNKTHRGPADCNALHSEIDALVRKTQSTLGATMYITRYPCEGCARAIVASGIKRVFFGRQQNVSELTEQIFEEYNVEAVWCKGWDAEDVIT